MNQFLTALEMRKVSYDGAGRPVYELLADLVFHSDRFGVQVMRKGRRTNLCSTPKIPLIYEIAADIEDEPCALHDDKYTYHDMPRHHADMLFLEMMLAPKVLEVQRITSEQLAHLAYEVVRVFGQASWDAPTTIWQPPLPEPSILAGSLVAP